MTKSGKLLERLSKKPKTFKYTELKTLLINLGYREANQGKTSGSRVAFYHEDREHIIGCISRILVMSLKSIRLSRYVMSLKEKDIYNERPNCLWRFYRFSALQR